MKNTDAVRTVRDRLEQLMPALASPDNAHTTALLAEMIAGRCLPHAVIIEGGSAGMNTQAAHIIARAYLCSCGTALEGNCRACHLFETYDSHPDMYVIEGSGSTGAISVDSVRGARSRRSIVPTDAEGTVYLLERGELMLKPAQNAFLKLFEEPPDGLLLILTCSSRMKLLETIRSRGTIFHFEWPLDEISSDSAAAKTSAYELAAALTAQTDADMLFALAPFCSGAVRADGQSMRVQLGEVLDCLEQLLRRAMLISAGAEKALDEEPAPPTEEQESSLRALASSVSAERLIALIRELEPLRQALRNNASMPLLTAAVTERLRRAAGK